MFEYKDSILREVDTSWLLFYLELQYNVIDVMSLVLHNIHEDYSIHKKCSKAKPLFVLIVIAFLKYSLSIMHF